MPVRYRGSLLDNVDLLGASGLDDESRTLRARAALEVAGADQRLLSLDPSTLLDPAEDAGTDLSGGQWQRVALARAAFRIDLGARLVVLDEPSSALDPEAESQLFERFLQIRSGATTVLVSHRLSMVRSVDRILVLDRGRLVEQGSHDDLISLDGRYARMFHLQASRFARPMA